MDIPKVFGAGSPEDQQLINDPDSFKDPETADYVGVARALRQGQRVLRGRHRGEVRPDHADRAPRSADLLPDEPGGYTGYQALFGHRYVAPQLGAGTPSLTRDGYAVTNAAGNLVDLNGNQIDGDFLTTTLASPATARSTRRSRWRTRPTCLSPASRWSTCTSRTCTGTSSSRA